MRKINYLVIGLLISSTFTSAADPIPQQPAPKLTEQDYQMFTLRLQRDTSANDIVIINAKLLLALDRIKELEATKNSCPAPAK